jgi:Domain of unknown function (DUF4340)
VISWRALSFHLVALALASLLAFVVWTKKDAPESVQKGSVQVWDGSSESVELVTFSSESRTVRLERRKDAHGVWYVGSVEKETSTLPPRHPDAGMSQADGGAPEPEKKKETTTFVSVKQGQKLAESLAPLYAVRRLGKIDDSRADEFGLKKPEGTLEITVGGKKHTLVIGGLTPGGGDRYAKDESGDGYAIGGNVVQNLLFAESRLIERELHGYEADEVTSAKIDRGGKTRDLVRLEEKKDGWADAATPNQLDETAGNWMTKLGRLRIMNYVEKPSEPLTPDKAVVHVDYEAKGGRKLGFIELYKLAGDKGKPSYLIRTEQTRWYADVIASVAEQVEQDLASIVKTE